MSPERRYAWGVRWIVVISALGLLFALAHVLLDDGRAPDNGRDDVMAADTRDPGMLSADATEPGNVRARTDGEKAKLVGRPDAHPAGGSTPANMRKIELHDIHGCVVDVRGRAIQGALVYTTGKSASRWGSFDVGGKATTDAKGRWSIRVLSTKGRWIGARAKGFMNAFVDGDEADVSRSIRIEMPYAERLRVLVLDANNEPVPEAGVRLKPIPSQGMQSEYPSPSHRGPERYEATDGEGFATFELNTDGPVLIAPDMDEVFTDPPEQWLPRAAGTVTFRIGSGAVLKLRVENESGDVLDDTAWVEVREAGTDRTLDQARYKLIEGRLERPFSFAPGWYDVRVHMKDRDPAWLPNVRLGMKDETPEHVVSMRPLPEMGRIEVQFSLPPDTKTISRPGIFVRRQEPGRDRRWTPVVAGKWYAESGAGHVFSAELHPGTYELAASAIANGLCGVRRVAVRSGKTTKTALTLAAGLRFKLFDVVPRDLEIRRIDVDVGRLGIFAPLGAAGASTTRHSSSLEQFVTDWRYADPVLGPYPATSATVHVTAWNGTKHEFHVR